MATCLCSRAKCDAGQSVTEGHTKYRNDGHHHNTKTLVILPIIPYNTMFYDRYELFKAVSTIFKLLDRSVGLPLYLVTEASRSR